jgi:hypothetical protein
LANLNEDIFWLSDKTLRPSSPTPLPERERGARSLKATLVPLLPLWEKGLGDEGDVFCQPTRDISLGIDFLEREIFYRLITGVRCIND